MNYCRECVFSFKGICTNSNCEHFGINYMTDFVNINDCNGFQEIPEGMRPKAKVSSKDDEDWFAQSLCLKLIIVSLIGPKVLMRKDYILVLLSALDAATTNLMALIGNIAQIVERKFCRSKHRLQNLQLKLL